MKWVTYQSDQGERAGVLDGDAIYAAPRGVTLLELIGRGADGLRQAGGMHCARRRRSCAWVT